MSDNRAYQDARKNKEPKMMVNVPIDHTTSRLSKAAKHFRFCTDEEGNIWAMPIVGYRFDSATGEMRESTPVPTYMENAYITPEAAVQNTWYTAFEGWDVEILCFEAGVTVADESVEICVNVDGEDIDSNGAVACTFAANEFTALPTTISKAAVGAGIWYFTQTAAHATAATVVGGISWLRGKHIIIQIRKTTAGGASFLHGLTNYHQW